MKLLYRTIEPVFGPLSFHLVRRASVLFRNDEDQIPVWRAVLVGRFDLALCFLAQLVPSGYGLGVSFGTRSASIALFMA